MNTAALYYCDEEFTHGFYEVMCGNCDHVWVSQFHDECFCPYCGFAFIENWAKPKCCKECHYCEFTTVKTLASTEPRYVKVICTKRDEPVDPLNSWCNEGRVNEETFYDMLYGESES